MQVIFREQVTLSFAVVFIIYLSLNCCVISPSELFLIVCHKHVILWYQSIKGAS